MIKKIEFTALGKEFESEEPSAEDLNKFIEDVDAYLASKKR